MQKTKKIHFVGIKGVGTAPLAIIAKQAGMLVTGCDLDQDYITDVPLTNEGIKPMIGFNKEHVIGVDLVITTGAHGGYENIENIEAKRLNIPVLSQGVAVAKFQKGEIIEREFSGISVTGTHGKTTTTAMIATILKANKLDPSFVIGTGLIPFLGSNGHLGKGKYFVAEADEYVTEPKFDKTPKMQWQKPQIAVITNIEYDHPDVYSSMEELEDAFLKFANGIENGCLVINVDSDQTKNLLNKTKVRTITYGFSKSAEFIIDKVSVEAEKTFFWVSSKKMSLGEFSINVAGEHNALNALSAIVVCLELGLKIESIKKGLLLFRGTQRRMEFKENMKSGAIGFDDYAHHPTEIKKTLATIKKVYPNKKIVCIFQPHTYSRTKALFEQFIGSFNDCNELVITKIYSSERETPDPNISSKLLSEKISNFKNSVLYIENLEDVVKYVDQKAFGRNYIIITMGAGDVYKIWEEIK